MKCYKDQVQTGASKRERGEEEDEKKRNENLSVKAGNCNKSIYNVGQNVTIGRWVCISVSNLN